MNIITLDDHIAQIDADSEIEAALGQEPRIALSLGALHADGTAQSVNHTVELDEQAVAHSLDQPAMMFRERGLENLMQVGLKAHACALLIRLAQAAIAGDVCDQDGGEPPLHPLVRAGA